MQCCLKEGMRRLALTRREVAAQGPGAGSRTQPLLEMDSVHGAAVHPILDAKLMVAALVVEASRGNAVPASFDSNPPGAGGDGRSFQPGQDRAADARALTIGTNGKQDEMAVFVPVRHDAEPSQFIVLSGDGDVGVRRRDGSGNALRLPRPRKTMLDQPARHIGDLGSVLCRSDVDVPVGGHVAIDVRVETRAAQGWPARARRTGATLLGRHGGRLACTAGRFAAYVLLDDVPVAARSTNGHLRGAAIRTKAKGLGGCPSPCVWWSRRESNPRPLAIVGQIYMLSWLIWL